VVKEEKPGNPAPLTEAGEKEKKKGGKVVSLSDRKKKD
jgi:hypothetical protein